MVLIRESPTGSLWKNPPLLTSRLKNNFTQKISENHQNSQANHIGNWIPTTSGILIGIKMLYRIGVKSIGAVPIQVLLTHQKKSLLL